MRTKDEAEAVHLWHVSAAEAVALQERLREGVRIEPLPTAPQLVAGADVAYSRARRHLYAAAAVVALPSLEVVEIAERERDETFPYVPGLFAFRELPALIDALTALTARPDVVLFDGHGIAHPRRFGLASHAGVLLDVPTIGCAKCLLVGRYTSLSDERGSAEALMAGGEAIGAAVRTRPGVMPVFVSPGHRIDIDWSVRVVLAASGGYRLPEPLRAAHHAAVEMRARRGTVPSDDGSR